MLQTYWFLISAKCGKTINRPSDSPHFALPLTAHYHTVNISTNHCNTEHPSYWLHADHPAVNRRLLVGSLSLSRAQHIHQVSTLPCFFVLHTPGWHRNLHHLSFLGHTSALVKTDGGTEILGIYSAQIPRPFFKRGVRLFRARFVKPFLLRFGSLLVKPFFQIGSVSRRFMAAGSSSKALIFLFLFGYYSL